VGEVKLLGRGYRAAVVVVVPGLDYLDVALWGTGILLEFLLPHNELVYIVSGGSQHRRLTSLFCGEDLRYCSSFSPIDATNSALSSRSFRNVPLFKSCWL
jgi:hypothetical protein